MKKLSWWIVCLFLASSCTKNVKVGQDEVGLVFSYWDGEVYETLSKPGTYDISYISGFTAAKIIRKNEVIKIERETQEGGLVLNIKVNFKPWPERNFELLDSLGLDYDKTFVRPLLIKESEKLKAFEGTDRQLLEQFKKNLKNNDVLNKYLEVTSIQVLDR